MGRRPCPPSLRISLLSGRAEDGKPGRPGRNRERGGRPTSQAGWGREGERAPHGAERIPMQWIWKGWRHPAQGRGFRTPVILRSAPAPCQRGSGERAMPPPLRWRIQNTFEFKKPFLHLSNVRTIHWGGGAACIGARRRFLVLSLSNGNTKRAREMRHTVPLLDDLRGEIS